MNRFRFTKLHAITALVMGAFAIRSPATSAATTPPPSGTVGGFSWGELSDDPANVGKTGCGLNFAGEPAVRVSPAGNVFVGSEESLGAGSEIWRGLAPAGLGGASASGCGLELRPQPNAVDFVGAAGGDIDLAIGSATVGGNYPLYVASLNGSSVSVAHSTDNATTFSNTPVQAGLPVDDREWIAAFGASTSLLTFHDIATNNINVLRSDNGGTLYTQTSRAIPDTDCKSGANELGNIAIDRRSTAGTKSGPLGQTGFRAYQSFVAPTASDCSDTNNDEAFVAVSLDGGFHWTDQAVGCSRRVNGISAPGLDHSFPNVSVDPAGNVWLAWSDDTNVFVAESTNPTASTPTWTCSSPISTNTAQAVFPWIAATSAGDDLVYYGTSTAATGNTANETWSVYFAQRIKGAWGKPQKLLAVHAGPICEVGVACLTSGGRQLFDDFGVAVDPLGWAHIAFTSDADPNTGRFSVGSSAATTGGGSATGYAVQTAGTRIGATN